MHSHRDAVTFHLWSYAHLPLYLGIAVAAAGLERMVHLAAEADPRHAQGSMLAVALGLVMAAMVIISAVNPQQRPTSRAVVLQVALAGATAAAGFAESLLSPAGLVIVLAALCAAQLGVSRGAIHTARVRDDSSFRRFLTRVHGVRADASGRSFTGSVHGGS